MIRKSLCGIALMAAFNPLSAKTSNHHGYPINPVPFTSVKVTDTFWGQRLEASRTVTIPLAFSKCEIGRASRRERVSPPV